MRVSRSTLMMMAALTWYLGGGVLLYKGGGYLIDAAGTGAVIPPVLAGLAGAAVGLLRGRTMFVESCRRNLRRIERLDDPRVWQFFRPGFFAALALMIAAGAVLARVARTGYWGQVVVGGLELVIATALLTSSVAFWRWRGGGSGAEPGGAEPGGAEPGDAEQGGVDAAQSPR